MICNWPVNMKKNVAQRNSNEIKHQLISYCKHKSGKELDEANMKEVVVARLRLTDDRKVKLRGQRASEYVRGAKPMRVKKETPKYENTKYAKTNEMKKERSLQQMKRFRGILEIGMRKLRTRCFCVRQ